jgi:mitochondrial pyruvate carrier 2
MATPMRFGLRAAQTFRQPVLRQNLRFTQRRTYQSAAENPANVEAPANDSAFTKFWNSPVGPKTVHFWAPIMKV